MKLNRLFIAFMLVGALVLSSCNAAPRVGVLRTESQSVKLGDTKSVSVEVVFGSGVLTLAGGAENLLDADFTYNVAKLKPEVKYSGGELVVRQPETKGMPALSGIMDFRNEWGLRLDDQVPMDLHVDVGAGTSNLKLGSLSLTKLDVDLGATAGTIDLSGDWTHNLDITIDTGAGDITVRLPRDVGVRITVDRGATLIQTNNLAQDGNIYTNAAYGVSDVTLQIVLNTGIGLVSLDVEEPTANSE